MCKIKPWTIQYTLDFVDVKWFTRIFDVQNEEPTTTYRQRMWNLAALKQSMSSQAATIEVPVLRNSAPLDFIPEPQMIHPKL